MKTETNAEFTEEQIELIKIVYISTEQTYLAFDDLFRDIERIEKLQGKKREGAMQGVSRKWHHYVSPIIVSRGREHFDLLHANDPPILRELWSDYADVQVSLIQSIESFFGKVEV